MTLRKKTGKPHRINYSEASSAFTRQTVPWPQPTVPAVSPMPWPFSSDRRSQTCVDALTDHRALELGECAQ
jgi:hypothetical protein